MDEIIKLMSEDIVQLNDVIRRDLTSNIFMVRQISEYIINSGGKRIRPLLVMLCGRIAGYVDGELLHKMAAMIEYIHTATLLHDDVVDESGMRRGRKTANAVFGNAASVLVGDFIYTRSFQMMIKSGSLKLLEVMANSTNQISEGEVLQLLNIGRSDLTEAEYFAVIRSKTAVLFEAAARVAAIVAHGSTEVEESLAEYACCIGTAFQIADDILDYVGESAHLGKNIGDDLLEGKVTLPLIYLLEHGVPDVKLVIIEAINNPTATDINLITNIVKNSNAIKYCSDMANDYVSKALNLLNIFPDSAYKSAMQELAKLSVDRIT
ncbi:MAG: polyprenyl synthetase family protein [Proteobacteria bacterium]|jgi:octaprenyl-diphosphate synthase|nr:polyprenyl synthetase family protein [Pseudomonadota bacterium]